MAGVYKVNLQRVTFKGRKACYKHASCEILKIKNLAEKLNLTNLIKINTEDRSITVEEDRYAMSCLCRNVGPYDSTPPGKILRKIRYNCRIDY